ncbi:MAG: hypothetical protein IJW77_17255 [Clostridia bacterium]|nr:hypothetical protein [Clostridia bacterium]
MISPRQFFEFVLVYIGFFACMLIAVFTFGRASTMSGAHLTEEERYVMEIEALEPTPYFSLMPKGNYSDFESLIKHGTPNLVVRVTLEDRDDAEVYDPHGYYTTDLLEDAADNAEALLRRTRTRQKNKELETDDGGLYGWNDNAAYEAVEKVSFYIATPYTAHVEEILLGDAVKIGDEFTFYAPYGIIDDFYIRYEDCPIYMAGREYILFFSLVDVEGIGRWYDLVHPSAAGEIMIEDNRTFLAMSRAGETMFADTGYDCETLAGLLSEYYTEYPYDISIPTLPRMKP